MAGGLGVPVDAELVAAVVGVDEGPVVGGGDGELSGGGEAGHGREVRGGAGAGELDGAAGGAEGELGLALVAAAESRHLVAVGAGGRIGRQQVVVGGGVGAHEVDIDAGGEVAGDDHAGHGIGVPGGQAGFAEGELVAAEFGDVLFGQAQVVEQALLDAHADEDRLAVGLGSGDDEVVAAVDGEDRRRGGGCGAAGAGAASGRGSVGGGERGGGGGVVGAAGDAGAEGAGGGGPAGRELDADVVEQGDGVDGLGVADLGGLARAGDVPDGDGQEHQRDQQQPEGGDAQAKEHDQVASPPGDGPLGPGRGAATGGEVRVRGVVVDRAFRFRGAAAEGGGVSARTRGLRRSRRGPQRGRASRVRVFKQLIGSGVDGF